MNRVPAVSEGVATTAPGRGATPGRLADGGDTGGPGSRGGAPAQPERTRIPAANRRRDFFTLSSASGARG